MSRDIQLAEDLARLEEAMEQTPENDARLANLCCGHATCQNIVRDLMAQAWDECFDYCADERANGMNPANVNPYARVIPPEKTGEEEESE